MFVGSDYKVLYRIEREPIQIMVCVVEGSLQSSARFTMEIGFDIGIIFWPLLNPLDRVHVR